MVRVGGRTALCSLATLAAACASGAVAERDPAGSGVSHERGAFVISGPALEDGRGSVLATLAGKVPNFRVRRGVGSCPRVAIRSPASYRDEMDPDVYVDGTRATDMCVLESLRAADVRRIEVYPQGFTHRPGYGTAAHGLILIFMRSARGARL